MEARRGLENSKRAVWYGGGNLGLGKICGYSNHFSSKLIGMITVQEKEQSQEQQIKHC